MKRSLTYLRERMRAVSRSDQIADNDVEYQFFLEGTRMADNTDPGRKPDVLLPRARPHDGHPELAELVSAAAMWSIDVRRALKSEPEGAYLPTRRLLAALDAYLAGGNCG